MAVYSVYGMIVQSELDLPELQRADGEDDSHAIDVQIKTGDVPEHLPDQEASKAWLQVCDRQCLLRFSGIGRFLIDDGQLITVQKDSDTSYGDLRGFLLGSGLAAAAHQRGVVPLHVSAVLSPSGVIAFTGESGAGKSTMAARLNQNLGWPLISDDVSALSFVEGIPTLESGVHTVKLWSDALQAMGRSSDGLRRDLTRYDKFHAIATERFETGRFPLTRLVELKWGDEMRLETLSGRKAFCTALNSVYRPELARACGNGQKVVAAAVRLASMVAILDLSRPKANGFRDSASESIKCLVDYLKT